MIKRSVTKSATQSQIDLIILMFKTLILVSVPIAVLVLVSVAGGKTECG